MRVTVWADAQPTLRTAEDWVTLFVEEWAPNGWRAEPTLDGMTWRAGELTQSPRFVVTASTAA